MNPSVTTHPRRRGAVPLLTLGALAGYGVSCAIYAWHHLSSETQAIVTQAAWLIFTN